jgi:hypothetical protein
MLTASEPRLFWQLPTSFGAYLALERSIGEATTYRYLHFQRKLLREDASFTGGVRPGERFPEFDLTTTTVATSKRETSNHERCC